MRTSKAGTWNSPGGYTLIELTVVITILAVLVGFLIPRFTSGMFGNDHKAGLRILTAGFSQARNAALLSGIPATLVLQLGAEGEASCLRVQQAGEEDQDPPSSLEQACLPEGVRIARVHKQDDQSRYQGEVTLLFLPTGLTEPATIELVSAGGKRDLVSVLPFNARLQLNTKPEVSGFDTGM